MSAIVEVFVPACPDRSRDHWEDIAEVEFNKHYATREAVYDHLTRGWPADASIDREDRDRRYIDGQLYYGDRAAFEHAIRVVAQAGTVDDQPSSHALAMIEFARVLESHGDRVRLLFYTG